MTFRKWGSWGVEFTYLNDNIQKEEPNFDLTLIHEDGSSRLFRTPSTHRAPLRMKTTEIIVRCKRSFSRMKNKKLKPFKVYNDEGCVEVASPVFQTIKDMKSFYFKISQFAQKNNIKPHLETEFSGGGHIHVALKLFHKKMLFKFLVNLYSDISNRPYLNWMFNEVGDDVSARPYTNSSQDYIFKMLTYTKNSTHDKMYDMILCNEDYSMFIVPNFKQKRKLYYPIGVFPLSNPAISKYSITKLFSGNKGRVIRLDIRRGKRATIEFRFLDAYDSYEQLNDCVEFVHSYLRYIEKITKEGKEVKYKRFNNNRDPIPSFKKLLRNLNLPYSRYKKYALRHEEWYKSWKK